MQQVCYKFTCCHVRIRCVIEMAGLAEGSSSKNVLSLQQVIEEDAELEQMANAVLGASDDKKCTYPQVTRTRYGISAHVHPVLHSISQGYVKRQALYACASCDTTGPAGVCLACSLTCHKDHELYELYTKRFECAINFLFLTYC